MASVLDHPAADRAVLHQASPVSIELPQAEERVCSLAGCGGESCRVAGCPPKRWLFAGLGSISFAIALAGIALPVVPTTFPLMCSLLFFARSSPALERRVREFGPFRPYIKFVDGSTPMPMRAKVISCVLMWAPVLTTAWLLATRTDAPAVAWMSTIMLAVIGTPVIFFWRPRLVG